VAPLRLGTRGLALAVAGFRPVRDNRGERDLFHKPLLITRHAVADDLASAAHLLMGETDERTPFVLIKDAPITLAEVSHRESMLIPFDECVYASSFKIQPLS
jgi:F420-0:gamma-glutamyl ligase